MDNGKTVEYKKNYRTPVVNNGSPVDFTPIGKGLIFCQCHPIEQRKKFDYVLEIFIRILNVIITLKLIKVQRVAI